MVYVPSLEDPILTLLECLLHFNDYFERRRRNSATRPRASTVSRRASPQRANFDGVPTSMPSPESRAWRRTLTPASHISIAAESSRRRRCHRRRRLAVVERVISVRQLHQRWNDGVGGPIQM
jgi:hypothetical protein